MIKNKDGIIRRSLVILLFVIYLLDKEKHPLFVTQKNKRLNFESI